MVTPDTRNVLLSVQEAAEGGRLRDTQLQHQASVTDCQRRGEQICVPEAFVPQSTRDPE